jgi:hypothetical protein
VSFETGLIAVLVLIPQMLCCIIAAILGQSRAGRHCGPCWHGFCPATMATRSVAATRVWRQGVRFPGAIRSSLPMIKGRAPLPGGLCSAHDC